TLRSKLAEAICVPSGLKTTLRTKLVCPDRVRRGKTTSPGRSRVMSQTLTVRSGLAEASRLPSGLNASPAVMSFWPVRVKRSCQASRSHTFTLRSSEVPQASLLPSGLNAKESAARDELGMLKTSRPVVAFQILTGLQFADFLSVPASRVPS